MISKQQFEAQLQQIFRLIFENKTQEQIAHELNISTRTVARYASRIDKRYGEIQRQKNDDTLFLECYLFKNRMLKLYKALEEKAADPKVSGTEVAKCCEVAANICIDLLRMESEGIRAVKELGLAEKAAAHKNLDLNNNNNKLRTSNNHDDESFKEYNTNRKF